MKRLFEGGAEERAGKRNLRASIAGRVAENREMLEGTFQPRDGANARRRLDGERLRGPFRSRFVFCQILPPLERLPGGIPRYG